MDRLDQLMAQCSQDMAEIAASESEITSSSNRLLCELASARQTNMTKLDQETVKRNTETMLNFLITYTNNIDHSENKSAALSSALPVHLLPPDNRKMPANEENMELIHDSVTDCVSIFLNLNYVGI